jgi:hypothetical protein
VEQSQGGQAVSAFEPGDQMDSCNVICPYCGHSYQPEAEDYNSDCRDENCDNCGQTFEVWQEFTVDHITKQKDPQ